MAEAGEPIGVVTYAGPVVRACEPDPTAKAMFDRARAELVWLVEDGYVETRAELERANFRLDYRSDECAVLIGVHLGMSEVNVRIGPAVDHMALRRCD